MTLVTGGPTQVAVTNEEAALTTPPDPDHLKKGAAAGDAAAPGPTPRPPTGGDVAADIAARRAAFLRVQDSPEFQDLRSRYRRFVFPVTGGALAFYFLYVLLAAYAPGFMSEKVVGNFNIGLIFGLLQFVMVFGITALYIRYAQRVLDPRSKKIREELEAGGLR